MKKPEIIDNTIRIPSREEFLPDVDSFVEGILRGYGTAETTIADIAICVTELVNNSILHGNKSDPDKEVVVEVGKHNSTVEVTVTDEGNGFDVESLDNPIDEKNLLKEVGRGIFIVRSLMDNVDIDILDSGTRIKIAKNI
jgi:serine/threonine-protein kinase RsbW